MQVEVLVPIAFLTSAFTAMAGIGGGLVLVALMPGFLPAQAIVPVHGVVQLKDLREQTQSEIPRADVAARIAELSST